MSPRFHTLGSGQAPSTGRIRRLPHPVVVIVLVIGGALSALLFVALGRWERDRVALGLATRTAAITRSVDHCLRDQYYGAQVLAALYEAGDRNVGADEFRRIARSILTQCPSLAGVAWIPRVTNAERASFEAAAAREHPGFAILAYDSEGRLVRAPERPEYFPLLRVEPMPNEFRPIGFDVASRPTGGGAIDQATATGKPAYASHRSRIEPRRRLFDVVFHPVYRSGEARTAKARPIGFVAGISLIPAVVEEALAHAQFPPVDVYVYDVQPGGQEDLLYVRSAKGPLAVSELGSEPPPRQMDSKSMIDVEGHRLALAFAPTRAAYPLATHLLPAGGLMASVLTTLLLAGFLNRREKTREALSVEKLFSDTIIRSVPGAFFVVDTQARLVRWNGYLNQLFHRTDEELAGASALELFHEEDRERIAADQREVLSKGVADIEARLLSHDRGVRHFAFRCQRMQIGGELYCCGVGIDVTERKEAEAALAESEMRHRELAEKLTETDRRKDEFLAVLGHELRNPITPISNAVQILKHQREPTTATVVWATEVMDRQIVHLTRIVDDLLDVARITSGRLTLRKERVDLTDVVRRAVEAAGPFIDSRRHTLAVSLPEGPLWMVGDRARLIQVLVNLLNNSAKFTSEGGHIELRVSREGDEGVVVVRDDGMGIPADFLPHVFEMFKQGARPSQGLGIGLNLSRRLVEMHAGHIEAASPGPGLGSTFTVRLPLAGGGVRAEASASGVGPTPATRRRVLVVEDNEDVAQSFAMLLELLGQEVRTVGDGPAALEAAISFQPALVFVDIGLPGMDGYEVAERLRAQHGSKMRLVAMTGYGQKEDREHALRVGFDEHMVKPPNMDAVEKLLAVAPPPDA